jgi:hypothetical protein
MLIVSFAFVRRVQRTQMNVARALAPPTLSKTCDTTSLIYRRLQLDCTRGRHHSRFRRLRRARRQLLFASRRALDHFFVEATLAVQEHFGSKVPTSALADHHELLARLERNAAVATRRSHCALLSQRGEVLSRVVCRV